MSEQGNGVTGRRISCRRAEIQVGFHLTQPFPRRWGAPTGLPSLSASLPRLLATPVEVGPRQPPPPAPRRSAASPCNLHQDRVATSADPQAARARRNPVSPACVPRRLTRPERRRSPIKSVFV